MGRSIALTVLAADNLQRMGADGRSIALTVPAVDNLQRKYTALKAERFKEQPLPLYTCMPALSTVQVGARMSGGVYSSPQNE